MRLKSLEIQGFKSFPDKTKVTFGSGLTAVVGPNGSGKSNISDAVRWVLGEQSTKTLRGDKMEDVIFTGTKTRKPQGFAEVSLTIDNTDRTLHIDEDEVTITRRYDRSGESEYMMNRKPIRLRDLQESLLDTGLGKDGYSLVGQGKIAEIVQAKSTQRREIFEEAAGIAKFRYRKTEAQRNLVRAEENLARLRDIMTELESRLVPLRSQSEKAKTFLTLSAEKKELEVSIWTDTIESSNRALKDQSDKLLVSNQRLTETDALLKENETQSASAFEEMQNCMIQADALRQEKTRMQAEVSAAESECAVLENDIRHNEEQASRTELEILQTDQTVQEAAQRVQEKQDAAQKIKDKAQSLLKEQTDSEEKRTAIFEHRAELSKKEQAEREKLHTATLDQSSAQLAKQAASESLAQLNADAQRRAQMIAHQKEQLALYEQSILQADGLIQSVSEQMEREKNARAGLSIKKESREKKCSALNEEIRLVERKLTEASQKKKLLEAMEQSLDGYAYSVKEVLKRGQRGVLSGIHGTVSSCITVKDQYATAIETALSGSLQHIITENEQNAKAAIRLLQAEKLGRATFLPLSAVKGNRLDCRGFERFDGFVGLACTLVSFAPKYQGIIDSLLGRVVVAEDLDAAVSIAKANQYKFRVVTLDGQVVNAGGSMTGGSKNKSTGLLSRRNEISELQVSIETLTEKKQTLSESFSAVEQEVKKLSAEILASEAQSRAMSEDGIRAQSEKERLSALIAQAREQISHERDDEQMRAERAKSFEQTIEMLANREAAAEKQIEQIEQVLSSLKEEILKTESDQQETEQDTGRIRDAYNEAMKEYALLCQEIDMIKRTAEMGADQKERLHALCAQFKHENEEIRIKIAQKRARCEQLQTRFGEVDREIAAFSVKRQEAEKKTTALREEERKLQQIREQYMSESVRLEERKAQIQKTFDELIEKLWTEYELTRVEASKLAKPIEDLPKANMQLSTVRNKIRALGSVNVDAIEEYREVNERYTFLTHQVSDAEQAKRELLKLIDELTQQMKTVFTENFEHINRHFKQIFVDLFGGGRAELTMTDPSDVLETGIEIHVEPPGKVIKNLTLLSGGEQAFVAIAIYFAIMRVHPAPFCILDEIEAALDDVNVDKYAAYLKTLSAQTQFIMITHRRGTMEAADVLYGVTMQEDGVSKLLTLTLSDTNTTNLLSAE